MIGDNVRGLPDLRTWTCVRAHWVGVAVLMTPRSWPVPSTATGRAANDNEKEATR